MQYPLKMIRGLKGQRGDRMDLVSPPTNQSAVDLQIEELSVSYRDLVALSIPKLEGRGQVIAVIGHNGAGKSTFIKSTLGLLPFQRGTLRICDCAGNRLSAERDMAFCPENGAVFADISVESYVKLWCRIKQRDPLFYRKGGAHYLELLNIPPLLKKLGRELSKGQRRRVQTAIGFLTQPKLFLLDEPFDGLDVQKSSELVDLISAQRESMAFVISSHRMDVVERLADYFIVLRHGTVASHGTIDYICRDLAGTSIIISDVAAAHEIAREIALVATHCTVTTIGQQIIVTGPRVDEAMVSSFRERFGIGSIRSQRPSLSDAMHYHLRYLV